MISANRLIAALALALALTLALDSQALAQGGEAASPWSRNAQGELRLVSAVTGVGESGRVQLGLQFRLKSGW